MCAGSRVAGFMDTGAGACSLSPSSWQPPGRRVPDLQAPPSPKLLSPNPGLGASMVARCRRPSGSSAAQMGSRGPGPPHCGPTLAPVYFWVGDFSVTESKQPR